MIVGKPRASDITRDGNFPEYEIICRSEYHGWQQTCARRLAAEHEEDRQIANRNAALKNRILR
ncbi:MAG: hypothetical protein P1U65_12380 [Minwuia sp.]|nr:hypothetical protein [Minwuia sp.]